MNYEVIKNRNEVKLNKVNTIKIKQVMSKKTILIAIAALLTSNLFGQNWNLNPDNTIYYNNGNVGIGTTSPTGDLDIASVNTPQVFIQSLAASSQDAILNIRGSRTTSTTIDIAQIKFGSNDVTGGDLASITARKHTASTNEGDLLFWTTTTNGGTTTEKMRITKDGNIGIGTKSPLGKVDILAATDEVALRLSMPTSENAAAYDIKWANSNADVVHRIQHFSTYYDFMTVNRATRNVSFNGGNVAIGTTTIPTGYKLAVNGKIIATEIQVETGWADFVFEPTYNLMPLKELDTYIQENKHLPEIPTTAEVKENGISVGQMNAKLLQKIEELTLYTIQQQNLINNQQELIEVLKSGMETQNKRIEQIENRSADRQDK